MKTEHFVQLLQEVGTLEKRSVIVKILNQKVTQLVDFRGEMVKTKTTSPWAFLKIVISYVYFAFFFDMVYVSLHQSLIL